MTDQTLWLVGLLAADGWIKNDSGIGLAQSGIYGKEMIEHVKDELQYTGPIYSANTSGEISYSIYITNRKIVEKLKKFNIINRKSLIYELPKLPLKKLRSFIRGYIDGDGSVGVYDNGKGHSSLVISFVGTKNFINEIAQQIPIQYSNILDKKSTNCWEIRWYGEKAHELGSWIYSNKNLFVSKKSVIFANAIKPAYKRDFYLEKQEMVKKLLKEGRTVLDISSIVNIPFQTIYKWKKKY